ncbi:MAG: HAMP domain-containing protein [Chloroflexaceae bacterium]|nr:HAMP domain-containing protein [Chloroflexaceae bacterium]
MQTSLRNRITTLALLFTLLPLMLLGAVGIWQITRLEYEHVTQIQGEIASRSVEYFDVHLSAMENHLRAFGDTPLVRSTGGQTLSSALTQELFQHDYFSSLTVVDALGRERGRVTRNNVIPSIQLANRSDDPAFVQPMQTGQTYFGPVTADRINNDQLVTISVPLFTLRASQPMRILIGEVRLREPLEQITNIKYGQDGMVSIVDQAGVLLAHRDPARLRRSETYAPLIQHDVTPTNPEMQIGANITNETIITVRPYSRDQVLVAMVAELPSREALAPTFNALWWMLGAMVLTGCIALIGSVGVTDRLVRPIESLAHATQQVSAGNLEQQVAVTRPDELGTLQQNFNQMVANLREQQTAITVRNQQIETGTRELALRSQEIEQRNQELQHSIHVQQSLLATINRLSAPILPVWDQVIVLPLIGHVDTARANLIMESLLHGIEQRRAKIVILDVTGLAMVDDQVITLLLGAAQAVQLLGARVMLVGVSPMIAEVIVRQDVDLNQLDPYADLDTAIRAAIKSLRGAPAAPHLLARRAPTAPHSTASLPVAARRSLPKL